MLKNALFLLTCVVIAALAWGIFQILGKYTFLVMLVIIVTLLCVKVREARLSKRTPHD